jgi:Mn-dependent transcriptional regulator
MGGADMFLSPSLEDYLEEIYRFSLGGEIVRATDISHRLGVSLPSVSKALGKLRAGDYITYRKYGVIGLTDKGRQIGCYLVDRNGLLQDFLRLIHAGCDIGAEAEAMEHYLSRSTIAAIERLMKFMEQNPDVYERFCDSWQSTNKTL